MLRWKLAGAKNEVGEFILGNAVREPCEPSVGCCPCHATVEGRCSECVDVDCDCGTCPRCHGLGYTPSDSLEVWLGVRRQVTLRHRCTGPDFPKEWVRPTMKTTEDGRAEHWEASYPCPNPDHDQRQEYQTHSCLWAEAPEPLEAVLHALAPALGVTE